MVMKHIILWIFLGLILITGMLNANTVLNDYKSINDGEYTIVIEAKDWGPAVSKVVLSLDEVVNSADLDLYLVEVEKSSDFGVIPEDVVRGERTVIYAYVSDKDGNKTEKGNHITLVMQVGPDLLVGSPMHFFGNDKCRGNGWVDYNMTITNKVNGNTWTKEADQIMPLVDKFDLDGKFTYDDVTLAYASFIPETDNYKSPLIIWLHGGGEGGNDPTVPLMANRAANYVSDEIQVYFDGAYVLVPQCPGAWMDNEKGIMTMGRENDVYNLALVALIKDYVADHPHIDKDRIYVGGCSNGGYMSLKLIMIDPDYFAAAFISSLAYDSKYITDDQIESIKDVPIWFVHSADDNTTPPEETVLPVYNRLIKAGAKDVHLSYYDHVIDITGFFGGDNYYYFGHFSWIYLHANKCIYDFDGEPVLFDGRPATIMEWMAGQKN